MERGRGNADPSTAPAGRFAQDDTFLWEMGMTETGEWGSFDGAAKAAPLPGEVVELRSMNDRAQIKKRRPPGRGLRHGVQQTSDPNRHRVMEDVVGIVLLLDALQEWIVVAGSVVELRPEVVLEHVGIGVVDVAALVAISPEWGSAVLRHGAGEGIEIGVEIPEPLTVAFVTGGVGPGGDELQLHNGAALSYRGLLGHLRLVGRAAEGVDKDDVALEIDARDLAVEVLVVDRRLFGSEGLLHVARLVFVTATGRRGDCAAGLADRDHRVDPADLVHGVLGKADLGTGVGGRGVMLGHGGMHRELSDGLALVEDGQELVEDAGVVDGAIDVGEGDAHVEVAGAAVGEAEDGEEAPGVLVAAAGVPVVAVEVEDAGEALLGHALPLESDVTADDLGRGLGKRVEVEVGDDAEVSASASAAGAQKVGVVLLVYVADAGVAGGVDGDDVECGHPVGGNAVHAREKAVASTLNVSTGGYGGAGSAGNGDQVALVELEVGVAEPCASADAVLRSVGGGLGSGGEAEVDDGSAGIVIDEVLVTVSPGTNRGTKTLMNDTLQCLCNIVTVIAKSDAACAVALSCGITPVLSVA